MATLLQQVLNLDNLRQAWNAVADNEGIPGVDHESIDVWRRNWEERLVSLARTVRANQYRPSGLRLRRIPKKIPGQFRILRIPTVKDRVLQRAVNQVLMPLYEKIFIDCSYGYRPERSLKDALARLIELREAGCGWLLDADIDSFFDQIDHELLLRFLQDDLPDETLLPLLSGWVQASKYPTSQSRGVPMGSPISPLMANVYLHRLDAAVKQLGWPMVRFADDFVVLTNDPQKLPDIYTTIGHFLADLRLVYEPNKTRLSSFEEGFTFLGIRFFRNTYQYHWEGKDIQVSGNRADLLFSDYLPEYQ